MPSVCKENYLRGVVICHGKSEWQMARYISTNLHLPIKTFARNNGERSIQITGLMSVLNADPFRNASSFFKQYAVEGTGRGNKKTPTNFKLFIIMDTDDCTNTQKEDYISKKMFQGHWLYDDIVPIYNSPSLEDILLETGIMERRIHENEKGSYYTKIFPINTKPLSYDTRDQIRIFKQHILKSKNTNLLEYVDYCFDLLA